MKGNMRKNNKIFIFDDGNMSLGVKQEKIRDEKTFVLQAEHICLIVAIGLAVLLKELLLFWK